MALKAALASATSDGPLVGGGWEHVAARPCRRGGQRRARGHRRLSPQRDADDEKHERGHCNGPDEVGRGELRGFVRARENERGHGPIEERLADGRGRVDDLAEPLHLGRARLHLTARRRGGKAWSGFDRLDGTGVGIPDDGAVVGDEEDRDPGGIDLRLGVLHERRERLGGALPLAALPEQPHGLGARMVVVR
jgi:hypothetical protein